MSSRPRQPDYVLGFYGALLMLATALFSYAFGGRGSQSGVLFYSSMAVFFGAAAYLFYFIARYNLRNPSSPIRLWLRACCGSALAFMVGAYNVYAAGNSFSCFLLFLLSASLAAGAGYYYVKDRSRILPEYYDRDPSQ